MAEARCRADWARTSAIMALAVNLVRDPRRTPAAKPNDFNPYAPRPKKPILRGKQLEILRDVFVKGAGGFVGKVDDSQSLEDVNSTNRRTASTASSNPMLPA